MQVTKRTWRMHGQCVPGSLSFSPTQELGNEATVYLAVLPYMYYKPEPCLLSVSILHTSVHRHTTARSDHDLYITNMISSQCIP